MSALAAFVSLSSWSVLTLLITLLAILIPLLVAYEILSRPAPIRTDCVDVNQQSEEVAPGIRRRRYVNGKKPSLDYEVPPTTYEVFTHGMKVSNDGACLGYRARDPSQPGKVSNTYTWLKYSQVRQRAHNLGSGLLDTGLVKPVSKPGNEENEQCFVGIYAKNSVEWFVTAQACQAFRFVPVPLYETLGPIAIGYILKQVGMTVMVVDSEASVASVLKAEADGNGPLKMIVCINPIESDPIIAEKCKEHGIELVTITQMEERGARSNHSPNPVRPEDLYMICYTSGTTGNPKGVMITHRAVTASLRQCLEGFLPFKVPAGQPVISYLPLAHMYEHMVNLATIIHGCKIGLFSGNVLNLIDDMQVLHPTMMAMVPRILNRLYQKTTASVQGKVIAKTILRLALYFKIREIRQGIYRQNSIWDYLVFRRIQKALGGKLSFLTIGSAPIAGKVKDFTEAALGLPVLEGYGQTESTAAVTFTLMQDDQPGQAGPPCEGVLVKLSDVPELDYNVLRDGVGEVLVKSDSMMKGYFRDEEKTRETIDADGWLHTGDVGRWTKRGALQIVDRKKHLFKLAQGEYVAPEKVENVLQQCNAVAIIFVDGDPLETFTVAVVAPDAEYVKKWAAAQQNGVSSKSADDINRLCTESVALRNQIAEELAKYGKKNGLNSIEVPKRIILVAPDGFSVQNGLLTPTMKLKRPDVRKKFKPALQALYALSDEQYKNQS